jgi:hypothetical protein|tara:strand:+ start:598 stop:1599 length:1002 start_codon:yes stop_codon:yes gene_type:complete
MEYTTTTDLGFKDTFKKWNGKYLTEDSYDTVISSIEYDGDVIKIYKPHGTLMGKTLLACIVKKAYKGKVYQTVKDTLFSIDDTSTMRANAAGPIDHDAMKAKGLIEGKDYVLRTPNSYYPLKKNGEFNRIAEANEIHSVLIGYKRGRFTGMIKASGWMQKKSNAKKLEALSQIANVNEEALKNAVPEVYNLQKTFADNCIDKKYHIGGSPMTALSANKYSTGGTTKMSAHLDGKDLEFGMTTMCVFRIGEFDGAYLCFPRYGIAIEADDGDVLIADSNELHGVTPITGEGVRLSCVAYCDEHVATMGEAGKTEKPIGPHAGNYEEKGTLGDFL